MNRVKRSTSFLLDSSADRVSQVRVGSWCGNKCQERWRQADFEVGKLFARRLGGKADHIVVEDADIGEGQGEAMEKLSGCGCGGRAGKDRRGEKLSSPEC